MMMNVVMMMSVIMMVNDLRGYGDAEYHETKL